MKKQREEEKGKANGKTERRDILVRARKSIHLAWSMCNVGLTTEETRVALQPVE